MKNLLFLFTLIALNSFAEKTLTYDLTVYSLFEHVPLQGIQVTIVEEEGATHKYTTNAEGKITAELVKKNFTLELIDTSGNHRTTTKIVSFYKENVREDNVYLRLSEELEGKLIESKLEPEGVELEPEDRVIDCTEKPKDAEYVGGMPELFKFIATHIIYPQVCIENNMQGKVYARFKVKASGEISDIKIVRGLLLEADEEVIRVISYMPDFEPATCQGKPVDSYYFLPVSFTLD